jgi:hypothetical protein
MLPLKVKRAMEAIKKKKKRKKKNRKEKEKKERKEKEKKENKEKGGSITIFYPHLCSCFSTCIIHSHHLCSCLAPTLHMREFSGFTSIIMWGI